MLLRIHPDYGLWHAYRFALALTEAPAARRSTFSPPIDLCSHCVGQHCLSACPVAAYTGAEVMSRIAAPMVGGMISSTVLTLAVIPAIYALVKQWRLKRGME